ncbi:MAG: AAA family ATPase, partial [Patescibacteria group bacterium]
ERGTHFISLETTLRESEKIKSDPIGLFLEQINEIPGLSKVEAAVVDYSYLSSTQRAESLWAVFQDVKGIVSGRKAKGKAVEIKKMYASLGILKKLYEDPETRAAYVAANKKQTEEFDAINGNYEKYQDLSTHIDLAEEACDGSARQMFSARSEGVDETDILLFETNQRQLAHNRGELEALLKNNPELGGLAQYETLREYSGQLRKENFIWSPSRRKSLEEIELAALFGKPLLLSGESGTGKTRLVEQAAITLTGRISSETPGKDTRFEKLIAERDLDENGRPFHRYKEIGEAVTGKNNTLEVEPAHSGRVVADDEFNLLPPAEQTERLARIATWTPGKKVRMPVSNEEVVVGTDFLYCAMVNLASQRYERKKIPPEVLRKFAKVDLDYPPQSEIEPELYEMMLATLIDENGRLRAATGEVSPLYTFREEKKDIVQNGQTVKGKVLIRELQSVTTTPDGRTSAAGGFLWRFSNALNELNKSISHRETVLKSKGDAQYVKDLIIDMGTVLGWLKEYGSLGRTASLENFITEKLKKQFLNQAAYSVEDRKLVRDFLQHFGIDVDRVVDPKAPKPEFTNLTALDIGLLSPRVKYEKVVSTETKVAGSYFVDEDGERVEYFIKPYQEGGKTYEPGKTIVEGPDKKVYEFLGVSKSTGEPILRLYKKKKPVEPGEPKREEGAVTIEKAKEIMTTDFLGPEAVEKAFKVRLEAKDIPPIPFSEAELKRAKELGQFLVLRTNKAPDNKALTMKKMNELLEKDFQKARKGKVLFKVDWYPDEEFYTTDAPAVRWALTSKEVLPNSTNQNYVQQTETLVKYVKEQIFADQNVPKEYAEAIAEFEQYHDQNFKSKTLEEIQQLLGGSDWKKYATELSDLKINQLTRQDPSEVLYDLLIYLQNNGRLLENRWTWTRRRASDGGLVDVGDFGADGARVSRSRPDSSYGDLGVSLSRSH